MLNAQTAVWRNTLTAAVATFLFSVGAAYANDAMKKDAALLSKAMNTRKQCQQLSRSCDQMTQDAPGILVFPEVIKADLIVGGAGGKGVLLQDGKITGYYNIGAGSAGLQAGVASASQVYVFRSDDAVAKLRDGSEWKAGASADVTLVEADANVQAATGDVLAYIFDSKGLHAGISLDVFRVWKSDKKMASND